MSKRGDGRPKKNRGSSPFGELRGRTGNRSVAQRVLIVCEDDKSAPAYFKLLKESKANPAVVVRVHGSNDQSHPKKVIENAIKRSEIAAKEDLPFDEVWCVIDGDYGKQIAPARGIASRNNIKLAITTPCFEYWLLLHLDNCSGTQFDASRICTLLKARDPNYDKSAKRLGHAYFDGRLDAIRRAKKERERMRDAYPNPEDQNPCSEVYLLVEKLETSP